MKKNIVITFLVLILISLVLGCSYFPTKGQEMHSRELAYSYLVNSYNSTLGLCYEYPNSNTYWISNDNVLAAYALQQWNRTIADNITETIKHIANEYDLPTTSAGIPLNCRAEILLGYNVDYFFNQTERVLLNSSYHGSILMMEKANNSIISELVFENYADLLCYASLIEWRKENHSGANYFYEKAKAMWDGNGFRDAAYNKTSYYATYKLGLFYFLNKMTHKGSFVFEKQLIERVWQCQDANGGLKTHYYGNGTFPVCQTNTETTAIILISGISSSLEYEENVKIGAYYYIWWGIPFNNHWNEAIKGTPFLGKYNSNDSTIADQHILLAKQHGIDFFAVSWIGEGTWVDWINETADHTWDFDEIDRNLQDGLLKSQNIKDFSFCLFYETEIILQTYWQKPEKNFTKIFIDDMIYAAQHYFNHPTYLHIDGKPVMFIYNLPYLYLHSPISAQELLDQARQRLASNGSDVYFIGDVGGGPHTPYNIDYDWLHSMNATTTYRFSLSRPEEGWNGVLEDARTYYPEWRNVMNSIGIKFIPNAYPGFNNSGLAGVTNPVVLPNNVTMFKEMLKIAINNADSNLKMVMITSWNEWLESTAIEPSMESGELFLHAIYDVVVPEFASSTFLLLFVILTMLVAVYSKKNKTVKIEK